MPLFDKVLNDAFIFELNDAVSVAKRSNTFHAEDFFESLQKRKEENFVLKSVIETYLSCWFEYDFITKALESSVQKTAPECYRTLKAQGYDAETIRWFIEINLIVLNTEESINFNELKHQSETNELLPEEQASLLEEPVTVIYNYKTQPDPPDPLPQKTFEPLKFNSAEGVNSLGLIHPIVAPLLIFIPLVWPWSESLIYVVWTVVIGFALSAAWLYVFIREETDYLVVRPWLTLFKNVLIGYSIAVLLLGLAQTFLLGLLEGYLNHLFQWSTLAYYGLYVYAVYSLLTTSYFFLYPDPLEKKVLLAWFGLGGFVVALLMGFIWAPPLFFLFLILIQSGIITLRIVGAVRHKVYKTLVFTTVYTALIIISILALG